jgi:hypothetical protein
MTSAVRTYKSGSGLTKRGRKNLKLKKGSAGDVRLGKILAKAGLSRKARKYKFGQIIEENIVIDLTLDQNSNPKFRVVQFGAVRVSNNSPDEKTLVVNLKASHEALVRAKDAFITSGVKLSHARSTPKFRVDSSNPKILIREQNGRADRGQIVNGAFVPVE